MNRVHQRQLDQLDKLLYQYLIVYLLYNYYNYLSTVLSLEKIQFGTTLVYDIRVWHAQTRVQPSLLQVCTPAHHHLFYPGPM